MEKFIYNEKGQAMPAQVVPVTKEAFGPRESTEIRWLGGAGLLLNVRGTTILIDPLLTGFDMPVLFDCPLKPEDVPSLDAYLVTHIDNDHFSKETCLALKDVCKSYHSTGYVAEEMRAAGVPGQGHAIGETFAVGENVRVTPTPAKHNWQAYVPDMAFRTWAEEDYCGFWFDTPDGKVWLPGDSQLLESHLHMDAPDVILFDFSDNDWHIGLEGAVKLANAYPEARLVLIHWGTVDAPEFTPFNADPQDLYDRVVNPSRICPIWPGEALTL
ncbi:MAG: MBL fold metallo-hydrolase [Firmicutes bacterium]|nr:MBL fold metallo-hydrolase [Bacillota bacterium]